MKRAILISIVALVFLTFSHPAFGGTSMVINSATVDGTNFELSGSNFTAFGPLEIWIGSTCLTCPEESMCPTVASGTIVCSFQGTPAANTATGGTWTVSISCGNAPHCNEEIDVFIPAGVSVGCNTGDFVECYTGNPGTRDVGLCQSGTRYCTSGTWGDCEGEVVPQEETCDSEDNDCDGEVDEGDVCVTEPPGTCAEPLIADINLPFQGEGDTTGAANDLPTCSSTGTSSGPEHVWMFTPTADGTYTFTVTATFDSVLSVVQSCSEVPGSCLGFSDSPGPGVPETVTVSLNNGETVFILIDGFNMFESGPYFLEVE